MGFWRGFGFRVWGFTDFMVVLEGFRVEGLGFGFRVWGFREVMGVLEGFRV